MTKCKNLERIIKAENIKISQNALKSLIFISDGDMRQAINNLQACHYASQGNEIEYFRKWNKRRIGFTCLWCTFYWDCQGNNNNCL